MSVEMIESVIGSGWTEEDAAAAAAEGWFIAINSSGYREIRYLDDAFHDEGALDAVHQKAVRDGGVSLHRKAILWTLEERGVSAEREQLPAEARAIEDNRLYLRTYDGGFLRILAIAPEKPLSIANSYMAKVGNLGVADVHAGVVFMASMEERGIALDRVVGQQRVPHRLKGRLPTSYRVQWEVDAFDAETPQEAAQEAFAAMRRAGSTATCFTVLGNDGQTFEVDLSSDEPSAIE